MELLRFTDADGREWEVWEVGARLPVADQPTVKPAPRWLCFASGNEVRRLVTYPPHWYALRSPDLQGLLQRATPARHVPPLNVPPRTKDTDARDR